MSFLFLFSVKTLIIHDIILPELVIYIARQDVETCRPHKAGKSLDCDYVYYSRKADGYRLTYLCLACISSSQILHIDLLWHKVFTTYPCLPPQVIELCPEGYVTLTFVEVMPATNFFSGNIKKEKRPVETPKVHTWKLKWYTKDTLLKFVAIVKAIYLGLKSSPLPVKCIS